MKLLIFILFIFASCSLLDHVDRVDKDNGLKTVHPEFMNKEQVISEINISSHMKSLTPLTEEDNQRLKKLVDEEDFFPNKKNGFSTQIKSFQEINALPSVDLRMRDTPIKSQDGKKCSAFALTSAIENMINKNGVLSNLELSSSDTWSKYQKYSCGDAIDALTQSWAKICDEKYYPQYGTRSANCDVFRYAYISGYKYLSNNVKEMIRALNEGHVVYIGLSLPIDIVQCKPVVSLSSTPKGGHAMVVVGYYTDPSLPNDVILILKNSWGKECGDNGYHYMPASLCGHPGYYCFGWELESISTDPNAGTPIVNTTQCVEWKRDWRDFWQKKCIRWD